MNYKNEWLLHKPIAHRGLHDGNVLIPENTLLAFEKAIEKKCPIELDIQIIKDGTIIVFHDTNLIRSNNQKTRIKELTYQEVKEISIFNTPYTIPTLREVLELVKGEVPILIDIKNYTVHKELEKTLVTMLKDYNGHIALQSFNPFTILWLKTHTNYCTGYLVSRYNYLNFFNYFLMNKKNSIDFLTIDKKLLDSKYFTRLSKKNIPILLWTIINDNEKNSCENYCDNYIFEGFLK